MRFLCLHGRGTRGEILETQTEAFRSLFPEDYEYVFPDGEREHPPAPGADKIFAGPYLSFLTDYAVRSVAEEHEYIQEVIAEEGPFDAIIGYSQGGCLAASILLKQAIEKPWEPPPFKAAVFISSIRTYSASTSAGVDVTESMPLGERLDLSDSETSSSSDEDPADMLVRRLTPSSVKARIRIPTAHIYGGSDALLEESLEVVQMCDQTMTSTFMHEGGHEIPLEPETSKKIHATIEEAIKRSNMIS